MADWDEIKKLAADFQRTQTSDTLQRISERNCIDIIKKLSELKLLDLIYTCDGKEFVTPAHLLKEIKDEITVNGRMHIHDLASLFNVDFQHIQSCVHDLARDPSKEFIVILGQVIHSSYKLTLAREINDRLQSNGQLTAAELSKTVDLPTDFLIQLINEYLGTVIDGEIANHDSRTFYTTQFIRQNRARICGSLTGVSRPATIASLLKRLDIPERVFLPIAESLIKEGRLDATIQNRLYIPAIYAREQNEFIENFFKQNSYVEYEVLTRMDIQQPKIFLRKKFPNAMMLDSCCVSPLIQSQIESVIEECIISNGWVDLTTMVPSVFSPIDIEMLVKDIFKTNKQFETSCLLFEQTCICSLGFLATCKSLFTDMMEVRAQQDLRDGILLKHFSPAIVKLPLSVIKPSDDTVIDKDPVPKDKDSENDAKNNKLIDHDDDNNRDDDGDQDTERGRGRRGKGGKGGKQNVSQAVVEEIASNKRERERERKSKRGRASKRSISPDDDSFDIVHPPSVKSSTVVATKSETALKRGKQPLKVPIKEPLIFKQISEICQDIARGVEDGHDCPPELLDSIATMIWNDLNVTYRQVARQVYEEALKKAASEQEEGENKDETVEQEQQEEIDTVEDDPAVSPDDVDPIDDSTVVIE